MLATERERSVAVFERAKRVIPGGVNSPVRAFHKVGIPPLIAKEGKGAYIWDVDGKRYLDFCMGWGALLLGHAPPAIVDAVCAQLGRGSSFGITTEAEVQFASLLVDAIPSIEQVRFLSSGTEATMTAVRLARAATKRSLVMKFDGNYHGHFDGFLIQSGSYLLGETAASSEGVPAETIRNTLSLPYNQHEPIEELLRDPHFSSSVAAIIVEPVAGNMGLVPAKKEFLAFLRRKTEEIGALLIFDEVITGCRVSLGGAAERYAIEPDLICLGKVVGGGLPGAAVAGKTAIMQLLAPVGRVFQAGTFSGNPAVMEAGMATVSICKREGFYEMLEKKSRYFCDPILDILKRKKLPATLQRVGSMFTIFWGPTKVETLADLEKVDEERFRDFFLYLLDRGIYIPPSPYEVSFLSAAHGEQELAAAQKIMIEYIDKL